MEEIIKKNNTEYLSFVSVISAIAVMTLHTNHCFWEFSTTADYWPSANIIECVFYFGVPIFFMITGITLMDFYDRYTLSEYFVKRFRKVFIPFVTVYLIRIFEKTLIGEISPSNITIRFLYSCIAENWIISIFWFFTPLFLIYLSMPLFAAVEKPKRKQTFSYLVFVGFVFNISIPLVKLVFGDPSFPTPINIPVVAGELIWPLIGWLLHNCELKKIHKVIIYISALTGLLVHIIGTYYLSMKAGQIDTLFKGYQNVPCILYSIGVFVFLKDIGTKLMSQDLWYKKLILLLSKYTFAIYLLQIFFLEKFAALPFFNTNSIAYRLFAPYIIIPFIIATTWVLRKIPLIKNIVP